MDVLVTTRKFFLETPGLSCPPGGETLEQLHARAIQSHKTSEWAIAAREKWLFEDGPVALMSSGKAGERNRADKITSDLIPHATPYGDPTSLAFISERLGKMRAKVTLGWYISLSFASEASRGAETKSAIYPIQLMPW